MQQSLLTGLSALKASNAWLDRISNNLANLDTPGFAEDKQSFADTFTEALSGNATGSGVAGRYTPPGWWGGTGVLAVSGQKDFAQMPLQRTDNPLDFAVQGDGFFVVQGNNGQNLLTKAGNFQWSQAADGTSFLATQSGQAVLDTNGQAITAPHGKTQNVTVGPNGKIAVGGTDTGQTMAIAQIALPSEKLDSVGQNEFAVHAGAQPVIVNRGTNVSSTSTIAQGALSMSNVDMTVEMTDMIQAQRMFDLNSESIQMTNRMMGTANGIRT
jgi:flagellar basal body rod protein FlgG